MLGLVFAGQSLLGTVETSEAHIDQLYPVYDKLGDVSSS